MIPKGMIPTETKQKPLSKKRLVYLWMLTIVVAVFAVMPECFAAKKVIAVMPIENISGYGGQRVAEIMTEQLVDALYRSGRVTVVERNQLSNALSETGFQMTGAVDPGRAIELGKMTGAQYSLIGTVTMATISNNATSAVGASFAGALFGGQVGGMVNASANQVRAKIAINIRMINNETGEVLRVVSAEGSETGKDAEAALYNSCKEAADNFLKEIQDRFVGVVLDVEGDTVYIDAGAENGVRSGEILEICREGKPVQKPDGGMIMKYISIGKLKVVEVNSDHSVGKITDHKSEFPVTKGCIVRRIKK